MRAVLVANPKGGAGKTTLATNLSGYFANQGKKTTLCDLDRQQSSLRWMAFRDPVLPPITGYFAGNQISLNLPREADWVVVDAPAGLQGYKLSDYLKVVDKVLVPLVPSVFDMAATEDFLNSIRNEVRGVRMKVGIVAMRVDPRTRAASMLEEFLKHFDIPIVAYLRNTQNYVNVAAAGSTVFDSPRAKHRRDMGQWSSLIEWVEKK
ncbi:ParA family protein [Ferribacterium limneticum]|uniref:ParA family protein n=1 Tax=Ferribacterium limneticum TaxID=76259 RepID=UPI001CF960D2|nr:ParA family protein [Ferribacterium limneticum]UCV27628.1 ParA family protein [Ferribacterium limneticum]UCV31545.1 ParA family protein [Ferribacterium limneticum]